MRSALMKSGYHRHYNDRAILASEPYNTEAGAYLDQHFKESVTTALEACLEERPADPVGFVAAQLLAGTEGVTAPTAGSGGVADDRLELRLDGGVTCELRPARAGARPPVSVAGLPVVRLTMPSTYEIEAALGMLRESASPASGGAPAQVLLVVEPPPAPTDLVFVKGIPYTHDLPAALRRRARRCGLAAMTDYASRGAGGHIPSVRERALHMLRYSLGSDLASLQEAMESLVARQSAGEAPSPRKMTALAVLPAVQRSYLEVFDMIDLGFRRLTHPKLVSLLERAPHPSHSEADARLLMWGAAEGLTAAQRVPPAVLLVSYNPTAAPLTLARVLAAFVPYYETSQLAGVAVAREAALARVRGHSLSFCLEYWREVHRRREEQDDLRGVRRPGAKKRPVTRPPSAGSLGVPASPSSDATAAAVPPSTHSIPGVAAQAHGPAGVPVAAAAAAVGGAAAAAATAAPPAAAVSAGVAAAAGAAAAAAVTAAGAGAVGATTAAAPTQQRLREERREAEDTAFLAVVHALESIAATRIQAIFRGARVRAQLPKRPRARVAAPAASTAVAAAGAHADPLSPPYPDSLPPLLTLVAERLRAAHGELFGCYEPSVFPEPRTVPLFVPRRHRSSAAGASADDVVEHEEWHRVVAHVPPRRSAERLPHMDPLRRALEYHRLAGCDAMDEAELAQHQLTGFSALQHRAYNLLKSIALDVLYVAYTELFHRGRLPIELTTFSRFVERHHADVFAWFSQPHLVSRAVRCRRGDAVGTGGTVVGALCDSTSLAHERVLLAGRGSLRVLPSPSPPLRPAPPLHCIAGGVYLTSAALPLTAYEALLQRLAREVVEEVGGSDGSDGAAPGEAAAVAEWEVLLLNLCPNPMAYVHGQALVLAPRTAHQEVEGRAASAHAVCRVKVKSNMDAVHQSPANGAGAVQGRAEARSVRKGAATAEPRRSGVEGWHRGRSHSLVTDGVEERLRRLRLGRHAVEADRAAEDTDSDGGARDKVSDDPASGASRLSQALCGVDLVREERKLASELRRSLRESGTLTIYEPDTTADSTLSYKDSVYAERLCAKSVTLAELAALPDSMAPRRSTALAATVPAPGRAAPAADLSSVVLDSSAAMAVLASRTRASPRLRYERAWLPAGLAGTPWLTRLERYVEFTLGAVKSCKARGPGAILLAAPPACAEQTMFVAAAVLLANAVDAVTDDRSLSPAAVLAAAGGAAEGSAGPVPVRGRQRSVAASVSAETAPVTLGFLEEFCDVLRASQSRAGVSVDESVAKVCGVLNALHKHSPESFFTVDTLLADLAEAEEEPSPARCRDAILRAVRRAEHVCWLLLLQVYLTLPFTRSALDARRETPIPSLASQVESVEGALLWMRTMDPWRRRPDRCPDAAHLRYSNGLRRWDCTDYICFGAC